MTENNRKKIHNDLEVVQEGFANGVAPGFPLDDKAKTKMIEKVANSSSKRRNKSWITRRKN